MSVIKTHGFLTRAQFQCGFTSYNEDMMKAAKDCSAFLSENETKELLGTGMKLFDRNEKERGHDQLCQEILKEFPNIVRNEQNKPNSKVDNAKKEIVKGVISDYGCGDNCYLTITDAKGKEITGLCTAPLCQQWNENAEMPAKFKGKKVKITVGKGLQYDGEGNVMGETESFEKIDLLK